MGVLDRVFKKELTEEELQAKEDSMMKSSEEKYEEEAKKADIEEKKPASTSSDRTIVHLERDIELLKVQVELMKQAKQVSDERFSKVSEQMGEIRATVLDSERDAATIKMQAEKAIELIKTVQPERLMTEVKKLEAKIEAAKGVEEKFAAMQNKLVTELKDLRQRTEAIRGSETIMRLNEEVKGELSNAIKIQTRMGQRADKVEAIYADFQQHYYEYQKVFDRLRELDVEFKDVMKEFTIFKVKVEGAAAKADFLKLKNELKDYGEKLDGKIIEVDKSIAKAEMLKADIMKDTEDEMDALKAEILKKITTAEQASEKIEAMESDLEKKILAESALFKKEFDARITKMEDAQEELESGRKELKSEVDKARKELNSNEGALKDLKQLRSDVEKRLKAVETRSEDLFQKANRKIDSFESDVQENTSVLRDLVKEVYSLKTHSANAITRNDFSAFQKAMNEKLIVFDMALIKLEHHINDYESTLRNLQRDSIMQMKDFRKEIESRMDELESKEKGNSNKRSDESKDIS